MSKSANSIQKPYDQAAMGGVITILHHRLKHHAVNG